MVPFNTNFLIGIKRNRLKRFIVVRSDTRRRSASYGHLLPRPAPCDRGSAARAPWPATSPYLKTAVYFAASIFSANQAHHSSIPCPRTALTLKRGA